MNKITKIEAIPFCAHGLSRLVVVVDTESGHSGIGESGLTGRELAVMGALEHLAALLVGQDADRIEHLWQVMFRGGFFPADRVLSSAISAIDIALWDVRGKTLGVPLYQLLGGAARDRVVCYPHNAPHDDVESLLESCRRTVADGWKFVRWGLPLQGPTLEPVPAVTMGITQIAAVREEFGDAIEIIVDLHTRLDPPDALRFCRLAEPYRPFFIEDPVRVENQVALRRLRQQTAVPLAAGEQFGSKWEFRALLEEQLVDYARVDVCIVGGITEAKKIAGWCETHYIRLATHNPLGPVSTAACLHLNLACSNVGVQEQPRAPGTDPVLAEVFPVQVPWRDGFLLPPELPGLGIEFNRDAATRLGFEAYEVPRLRGVDGSFTNW